VKPRRGARVERIVGVRGRIAALTMVSALAVAGAAASADSSERSAEASAVATVSMGDNFFSPVKKRVKPRTKVTWTNGGQNPHTATASNGTFNTGTVAPGEKGSRTFKKLGKFPYFCRIHPNMRGTIKVCKKVNGVLVCKKPS
jgi:plastocyanin